MGLEGICHRMLIKKFTIMIIFIKKIKKTWVVDLGQIRNVFSSDTSDMDVRKVIKIHLILEKTILNLYC